MWLANMAGLEKEIVALAAEATKLDAAGWPSGPVGARDPGCGPGRTSTSRCGSCATCDRRKRRRERPRR